MQTVVPLNKSNSNYYSTDIVVSLDDKHVGVVIGETDDKIIAPVKPMIDLRSQNAG